MAQETAMAQHSSVGKCGECNKLFEYTLVNNGFNNSSYAYCLACGRTAILDLSHSRFPLDLLKASAYRAMAPGAAAHLKNCECGGTFAGEASPRCPHCSEVLSATKAEYLARNAPGSAKGWRWQGNWSGTYCIVIEEKQTRNNFK